MVFLQLLGNVDGGGPVVLQFGQRSRRIDRQHIHDRVHRRDHAHRLRKQRELYWRLLVVTHTGGHVVGAQAHGMRQAHHGGGLLTRIHHQAWVALLRHGARPISGPLLQQQPRASLVVLGVDVVEQGPQANGGRGGNARGLDRDVEGGDLPGIVGVLDQTVEPEQVSHAAAVQRPARVGQHGGAHGAAVEPGMQFTHALGVPRKRGFEGQQVVGIADGLGLDAVGVGRHHRVDVPGCGDQHTVSEAADSVVEVEHLVAQLGRTEGGVHVLPAAPGVDQRRVRPDVSGDDVLDLDHV